MRAFVTGAAGPLGRALTNMLQQRGDIVVGQVRRISGICALRQLGAEPVVADLTRASALVDAMAGCDVVFHVAQFFDFWAPQQTIFHTINVFGAENAMAAALRAKVPRVVFCSSSLTIGEQPGYMGTEKTQHRGYTLTAFERSKLAAEQAALHYRAKGIEVVIVNPALVVAPSDPGWTGRLIADGVAGRRRYAPSAPLGWVSVSDAAKGLVYAAEHGESGARYILCGDTLSQREFLSRVARLAGQRAPRRLPRMVALGSATVATTIAGLRRRRPALPPEEARFATIGFRVDGSHARTALGLEYTPIGRYLPAVVASYRSALTRFA